MPEADPAQQLIEMKAFSTPTVYRESCYICRDPEFAQMGLPLCSLCPSCKTGHVPADDPVCDDCGFDLQMDWESRQEEWSGKPDVLAPAPAPAPAEAGA